VVFTGEEANGRCVCGVLTTVCLHWGGVGWGGVGWGGVGWGGVGWGGVGWGGVGW
jgi:hypothetical protein